MSALRSFLRFRHKVIADRDGASFVCNPSREQLLLVTARCIEQKNDRRMGGGPRASLKLCLQPRRL